MKGIIIPDPHATPTLDNDRFDAVGEFILEERPDFIVCLGDLFDFRSLSSYDQGTVGAEGQRYQEDLDCGINAQQRLFRPIKEHNGARRASRHSLYQPETYFCLGNHEDRAFRMVSSTPSMQGFAGTPYDHMKLDCFWDHIVPFKESVEIEGIRFSHYFASGVSGRPISGENIGKTMCNKLHISAVQGHSHIYDHAERSRADGHKIFGMSAGCMSHPDYAEGWCRDTVHMWWRGVIVLNETDGRGYYDDKREITLRKLMRDKDHTVIT